MRSWWTTGAITAAALALAACGTSAGVSTTGARPSGGADSSTPVGSATTSPPASTEIEWGSCDPFDDVFVMTDLVGLDRDDMDCATFAVPLDYAAPAGATIDLAVGRYPARHPDERIGSLFLNPGGPGGSGLEFLPQFVDVADDDLLDKFDIVSFDPRGVSASTPINCFTDEERDANADTDPTPPDEGGVIAMLDVQQAQNAACVATTPDFIARMGTENVVRDLDRLRDAVGDEQLSYYGFSYGTLIGALYAERFPQQVRGLVLDGSMPPDSSLEKLRDGQFDGFRLAFEHFVAACHTGSNCTLDDVEASTKAVLEQAAQSPIPTSDPLRPLTEGRAYTAIVASMYDATSWSFVWEGIDQALDGNASVLGFLADLYAGRHLDGSWTNSDESDNAVTCADYAERPTRAETQPRAEEILSQDPLWGPVFAYNTLTCEGWSAASEPIPPILHGAGVPPIIVIGTTGDPATPYRWAQEMAASLESGVLVTYEGDGHTSFATSKCADAIAAEYFTNLTVPADGQVCAD